MARRSSTALIVPVRRYSAIFAATDEPTPGTLVSPFSGSVPRSSGWPATALAAFS